jgi:hypothetical protein
MHYLSLRLMLMHSLVRYCQLKAAAHFFKLDSPVAPCSDLLCALTNH